MSGAITAATIGIAGTALSIAESRKQAKAADEKEARAREEARRIRENTRVEEAKAKFQAGVPNREMQSADDFLNPLRIV